MPIAVYALAAGAFGIGTTEFVIMGLLLQVSADLGVSVPAAGLLISGYALGVFLGAPLLTLASRRLPRRSLLLALMAVFTLGNLACALAPGYEALMAARIVTSLAHGTFFGVGAIVATELVPPERRASAVAAMFMGLTAATLLGVPFGAWLGLAHGWRATFWAVAGFGVLAILVLARFLPAGRERPQSLPLRRELAVLGRPQVLLGLLMTVLGYAGVFVVFTYIQPLLTAITGFAEAAVSPILLLFGLGLALGNLAGGRLADRGVMRAVLASLALLALVLGALAPALHDRAAALVFVALLGAAAFATVAPLQMRVLEQAAGAGQSLASSLNIAAFNLGNALGAWLGGLVIDRGPGLAALPWAASGITLAGLAVAVASLLLERRPSPAAPAGCPS